MIPFLVGVLAVAVILAFLAVVALVASMLVLSGSEPLSPWDEETITPRPDCELLDSPYSAITMHDDEKEEE